MSAGAPRRELGRLGEQLAAAYLKRRGVRVLARNVRTRHGEIDLIAWDGRTLAFVEVKTRCATVPEHAPLLGLGARQRARLRRLAAAWLAEQRGSLPFAHAIRFDAIGVSLDGHGQLRALRHVEDAW